MSDPSDELIREHMYQLVRSVDVDSITTKQFISQLSNSMGGIDLKPKKKFIKATLTQIIDEMQQHADGDNEAPEEEEEEEELPVAPPPKKVGGKGGLAAEKEISAGLREFLGTDRTQMARTEIVSALWAYIREHDLQNPNDKREILLDERMQRVFGVDRFSMFHMAKYVGAHIYPYKPVDLTPKPKDPNKTKKRKAKDGKGNGKRRKKEPGEKRKAPASFTAPYRLSQELIDIVGQDFLSRPQVTSKLWAYIKQNDMQFPEDKRTIICDDKFKKIMNGEDRVTMFQMNKLISTHLLERLDPLPQDATPKEEPVEDVSEAEQEEEAETEDENDEED